VIKIEKDFSFVFYVPLAPKEPGNIVKNLNVKIAFQNTPIYFQMQTKKSC